MYQLGIVGLSAVLAAVNTVNVLYAGSLVTPMEKSIAPALRAQGVEFQGEPGGSKKLANLIASGVRTPDVFISVDPKLVAGLGSKVASFTTFGGTSIGVAWSPASRFASKLDAVEQGKATLASVMRTPGLKIGRTDPKLDPKGAYTIQAVKLWLGPGAERALLGDDENANEIFPEEDLLTRVDTGEVDVGFFYRTEAIARDYAFVALPGKAALTDRITYTLAIMKDAPHPEGAKAFADFILHGKGRALLGRAGVTYF